MTRTLLVGLGAAAVLLAACSPDESNFQDVATKAIEEGQSTNLAVTGFEASCDEPTSNEVGTVFGCTATTPEGERFDFEAEVTEGDTPLVVYTTNYDRVARILIESTMSSTLGVDTLVAACERPSELEAGSTFACTAELPGGDTIAVNAHVQPHGIVTVDPPSGVLAAANLPAIEAEAARVLSERVGQTVPAAMIDCGSDPIVAEAGEPFLCALIDQANPDVIYDAFITVDDLTKPSELVVEVASAPRP